MGCMACKSVRPTVGLDMEGNERRMLVMAIRRKELWEGVGTAVLGKEVGKLRQ